jgi:hypothetical protein
MKKSADSFNSRKFQGQVERELIFGGVLVGLIVGGGLIALFWGIAGLFVALLFFLGFWIMVGLIWGFLKLLEIFTRD